MIKAHRAHGYEPILRDVGRSLYGIAVVRIQRAFMALRRTPKGRALLADVPIQAFGQASMVDDQPLEAMDLETYYIKE